MLRRCTRTGCSAPATSTLTYAYADSTAVVGPLAVVVEPHSFDLCGPHARTLTVPRGWDVVRLEAPPTPPGGTEDIEALVEVVRDTRPPRVGERDVDGSRRGHLRVLRT